MESLAAKTVTAEILHQQPAFSSLGGYALQWLLQTGRVLDLKPQQRLSTLATQSGRSGETYWFVLAGQIAVVLENADRGKDSSPADKGREYLGWFETGDLFSDGYLDNAPPDGQSLDCVASTAATLLAIDVVSLGQTMEGQPAWRTGLARAIAASRQRFLSHQEPTRRLVQDFYLRHGYGASRRLRVRETTRCFDCDKCQQACAKRHGHARMSRTQARLGRLAFQRFCLDCSERSCLSSCPFGAMRVDGSGEIRVGDACTGCGACVRACSFGAIQVIETSYTLADFPSPIPVCNDNGGTAIHGLFVAGDVAGPRPIKAAIQETKRAVDAMRLGKPGPLRWPGAQVLDAIVVGAGIAGLAAAARCKDRGFRFVVLEKDDTLCGKALRQASTLPIRAASDVLSISRAGSGVLRVDLAKGAYLAQNVLVCTGRPAAGAPSLLQHAGVPMMEPGSSEMAAHSASRGTHAVAIKCDDCAGYEDRACLRACPTGSVIELQPQELFFEPRLHDQGSKLFSAMAFVEGVAEHRARQKKHRSLLATLSAVLLLALAAVGLECFLRRAAPEQSVLGMIRTQLGSVDPVWYSSGKGYGHWLGYIGTGFMLLTLLYPLRTRLGLLSRWGAQSSWLTVHLWVGFVGATLVTYHAAFKLDRWVALACYSMWTVVVSGAIGRYLYGMIHSGIGLVELEREALSRSIARRASFEGVGGHVLKLLTAESHTKGRIYTEAFVMLWHELRDVAILLWLRFAGLSKISDRRQRRQVLRCLADIASHRRASRFLESARRLLRYWNWVHIALTILMFVLSGFHITYGFMYKAV
jgi:Fe-S-cluster-containing hydrogenase component 2